MATASLVLSLVIHVILPFFHLVALVIRPLFWLATPCLQRLARSHFAWLPDSTFLGRSLVRLGRPMHSPCDVGLAVSRYTAELGQAGCVFCLCDIEEGEEIRELACRHMFHRGCLDRWVEFGRATCPLCRDSLLSFEEKAKLAEMDDGDASGSAMDMVAAFVHSGWWW